MKKKKKESRAFSVMKRRRKGKDVFPHKKRCKKLRLEKKGM